MTWLHQAYASLPPVLQDIACSVVGWRYARQRYSADFQRLLTEYEQRSKWSQDRVEQFRDATLADFVVYCLGAVPYYHAYRDQLNVGPDSVAHIADLSCLPILDKADVQRCPSAFSGQAAGINRVVPATTSGTTGSGLRFSTTEQAIRHQWAVWWRYRRWHGVTQGTWCAHFGGRPVVPRTQKVPPFWRINVVGKQLLFSGYHVGPRYLPSYIDCLRQRRPEWLHGYPSLLALIAAHILDTGADLGYRPRWVTTGAESLLPQQAAVIERAFGVRPRQHYGLAEGVANISECDRGRLHVDEDFSAVEFVPCASGSGHRVVGTNFTNQATPLVRYDTKDIVTLASGICPCGRPGRLVETIDGRREDYVVLSDGSRVGRMYHVCAGLLGVREAQVYQRQPGAITIRVVRGEHYSQADESTILQRARQLLGSDMRVCVDYVDEVERSRTGKLRFVVSDIPDARLEEIGR